jgi:hypothetical protein
MRKPNELCESAKLGARCMDDLCYAGDVTLCGFEPGGDRDIWDEGVDSDTYEDREE